MSETACPPARREASFALTLTSLIAALTLAVLDSNIVSTALPIIASELGGLDYLSWVVTSFMLAQSSTLLLYGKLSDMYGRRPLFLFAVLAFVAGSLLCGAAPTMLMLIVCRAVQGVGAAGIMTLSSATLADIVSPRERGRYQGFFSATFAIGSIAGPLVGGGLTSLFGWRSVFLINLPLGLVVFALLSWTLPRSARRERHDIDYAGAILIMVANVSGLLALSWGGAIMPWASLPIAALGAICLVAVVALIRRERVAREPVLDLRLFRDRVFTTCQLSNALVAFPFFGAVVFLPLYLQLVRGFVPAEAGLIIVPQLAGVLTSSILGGMLVSRTGHYKPFIVAGLTTNGCSLFTIGLLVHFDAPLPLLMMGLLCLGLGGGMCMPNMTVAVQNAVPRERLGAATAFTGFANSLSASAGIATSGAILVGRVRAYVTAHAPPGDVARLIRTGVTDAGRLSAGDHAILVGAYSHAVSATFLTGGALVALSVLVSTFIPSRKLRAEITPMPALAD